MVRSALQKLRRAMTVSNSLLCCGLDPDINRFPKEFLEQAGSDEEKVSNFLRQAVDITAPSVCAFKIQKAFFDALPGGHHVLQELIQFIHRGHPHIPVFIDCKIGDVEHTMSAYLNNLLGRMDADGVVINPYMGDEVLSPFASLPEKAGLVLVRTSNPGALTVQGLLMSDGRPLWWHVLELTLHKWNKATNLIPVLALTDEPEMNLIREVIPDEMVLLLAGFGAQGGRPRQVRQFLDSSGGGVFINSSRALLYAPTSDDGDWRAEMRARAAGVKEELNRLRAVDED